MLKQLMTAALGASALCLAAAPAPAQGGQCFFITQWDGGWKAPDDHTIYLGVSNRVYRLDLASSCPELRWPDARLITHDEGGSGSICTALDWDLRVASGGPGPSTPCIVSKMTLLTPDEAAAIPKKFKP